VIRRYRPTYDHYLPCLTDLPNQIECPLRLYSVISYMLVAVERAAGSGPPLQKLLVRATGMFRGRGRSIC
jgi:hypothetical protein